MSGYRIDIRSESQEYGLDEEDEDVEFETIEEGDGSGVAESSDEAEEALQAEAPAEEPVDEPTEAVDEEALAEEAPATEEPVEDEV